jgi:hypothetical protein
MIDSVLEGVRVTTHFDGYKQEWVVRISNQSGQFSVCGCPGEIEANLVAKSIAAVVALADCTFSEVEEHGKPMVVHMENLVEYDSLKDVANSAISTMTAFLKM